MFKQDNKEYIIMVGKCYLCSFQLDENNPEHSFIYNIKFNIESCLAHRFKQIKQAVSMKRILCEELHLNPLNVEILIVNKEV